MECEKCGGRGWILYKKDGMDYAKPCELLKYIFKIIDLDEDSLVLDFFS